jgi:transcriptional regulator with XRE-family HTH domain
VNDNNDEGREQPEGPSPEFKAEETVGEILLGARERANLGLEQVATETRISRQNLEYLETDNFEALPAKVYVRGFLRAYAERLGLDVEYILNKYEVQTGQTHTSKGDLWEIETEVVEETLHSPRILKRFVIPAAVIIVAAILIVKLAGRREPSVEPPTSRPDLGREVLAERSEERVDDAGQPGQEGQTAIGASDTVLAPAAVEPEEPEAGLLELVISAHEADSCWFELLLLSTVDDLPDTTLRMFLLMPGEVKTFQATDAFIFRRVGNPGSFDIELNGERLEILGDRGRVRSNVKLTADGIATE